MNLSSQIMLLLGTTVKYSAGKVSPGGSLGRKPPPKFLWLKAKSNHYGDSLPATFDQILNFEERRLWHPNITIILKIGNVEILVFLKIENYLDRGISHWKYKYYGKYKFTLKLVHLSIPYSHFSVSIRSCTKNVNVANFVFYWKIPSGTCNPYSVCF